ncbi:MAG: hypothetical protein ACFFKA_15630 [Candidatus Thorarchaeota archaeon]
MGWEVKYYKAHFYKDAEINQDRIIKKIFEVYPLICHKCLGGYKKGISIVNDDVIKGKLNHI